MAKNRSQKKSEPTAGTKSQPFFIGQTLNLTIDRLAYHSGHGVGRAEGFVVFVPFGVTGDDLSVEIFELHSSYATAKIKQVLKPSQHRRVAPCPVAGVCGGCHWQHIDYAFQVLEKQRLLKEALRNLKDVPLRPLLAAESEFRYRNRIQVHRQGQDVGFFAANSRQLVPIVDCWIAEQPVANALAEVRARKQPESERIEIARLPSGEVKLRQAQDAADAVFSQVNQHQNLRMVELAMTAIAGREFSEAIDLYCGSGNFTFPLEKALPNSTITGVEASRILIDQAKQQSSRIEWLAQTTDRYLKRLKPAPSRLIVLDPPRPGCDRVTREEILRLKPSQIVYVSCNPTTLARDLEYWLARAPYQIEFVQGVDMFPQTAHLEAVVSLRIT